MSTIRIKALRRFRVRQLEVAAGEIISLHAVDAINVVGGGRAVPLDAEAYAEAAREITNQAIRECGPVRSSRWSLH